MKDPFVDAVAPPTAEQLKAANMVLLPNPGLVAVKNGYRRRIWTGKSFVLAPPTTTIDTPLYAVSNYETPNVAPPPVPTPAPEYSVTYSAPNQSIPSLEMKAGATFIVTAAPAAPAGQVFENWGDGKYTYAPGSTYTMPAANVTLTAIYGVVPTPAPTPAPSPVPSPTPAPTPTPIPVPADAHPSGFAIPDPAPGFKRAALDDFLSKVWSSMWAVPPYNSVSKAIQDGIFLTSHAVLNGDSLLRMECYPDPIGVKSGWQISSALIAAVNAWATAGAQTATRFPVGTTFTWAGKWDTYPGITAINLLMSDGWTSEEDLTEAGGIAIKGSPDTQYEVTFMTGQGSNKVQEPTNNTGQDFSQWHVWQAKWTLQGTTLTCDGKLVASTNFVNNANQFWSIQPQTGDPNTPGPDASITAANPITQYLDWIAIDVPTVATRFKSWIKSKVKGR